MSDTVAVRGFVAAEPRHLVTEAGLPITSFRLVTTRRRYNRQSSSWEDGGSNWYTVSAFRRLALTAADSLAKGDPVLVAGRICQREWSGEKQGMTVEIEAETIGHDLTWGRSRFTKAAAVEAVAVAAADVGAAEAEPLAGGAPDVGAADVGSPDVGSSDVGTCKDAAAPPDGHSATSP